jgi:predicted aldo/keto reductase-like oxidoreductase
MINRSFADESLSLLGMGNMRLPTMGPGGAIDREKAAEIIEYGYSHGINYFDTAYVYHNGESEKVVGEVLHKYPRESYKLATKFFILANPDYKAVFEEQLEKLKTDYIDFYLCHAIFDNTVDRYLSCGCIEYFLEQKKKGRIRHLGFSVHASLPTLERFASHHAWDFAQIQLNYLDWTLQDAKEQYEMLTRMGIPVIVMEPLRGGRLAGLSPAADAMLKAEQPSWPVASWAFRWLMRFDNVKVILSGMSTLEQMKENVQVFKKEEPLTDRQAEILNSACDMFRSEMSVPCTSCRYCCDECPKNIDIPKILESYNMYKVSGSRGELNHLKQLESGPAACIACGSCLNHCPQSIQIPDIMKELSELLAV